MTNGKNGTISVKILNCVRCVSYFLWHLLYVKYNVNIRFSVAHGVQFGVGINFL